MTIFVVSMFKCYWIICKEFFGVVLGHSSCIHSHCIGCSWDSEAKQLKKREKYVHISQFFLRVKNKFGGVGLKIGL